MNNLSRSLFVCRRILRLETCLNPWHQSAFGKKLRHSYFSRNFSCPKKYKEIFLYNVGKKIKRNKYFFFGWSLTMLAWSPTSCALPVEYACVMGWRLGTKGGPQIGRSLWIESQKRPKRFDGGSRSTVPTLVCPQSVWKKKKKKLEFNKKSWFIILNIIKLVANELKVMLPVVQVTFWH